MSALADIDRCELKLPEAEFVGMLTSRVSRVGPLRLKVEL